MVFYLLGQQHLMHLGGGHTSNLLQIFLLGMYLVACLKCVDEGADFLSLGALRMLRGAFLEEIVKGIFSLDSVLRTPN